MALHAARREGQYKVEALLTTAVAGKASGHGVPTELIGAQAEALGLPLVVTSFEAPPSNAVYEERLASVLASFQQKGVRVVLTGDLFLEDIRNYREQQFRRIGMEAVFPLWQRDTDEIAEAFIAAGWKAFIASIDTTQLDASFVGRPYDAALLADLPDEVDPCAEHGAFHTFVYDGPLFEAAVAVDVIGSWRAERMCFARFRV